VAERNSWQPKDPDVARLKDRMTSLEVELSARIAAIERTLNDRWTREESLEARQNERRWQAALVVVSCVVGPLIVLGVLALLHLVTR